MPYPYPNRRKIRMGTSQSILPPSTSGGKRISLNETRTETIDDSRRKNNVTSVLNTEDVPLSSESQQIGPQSTKRGREKLERGRTKHRKLYTALERHIDLMDLPVDYLIMYDDGIIEAREVFEADLDKDGIELSQDAMETMFNRWMKEIERDYKDPNQEIEHEITVAQVINLLQKAFDEVENGKPQAQSVKTEITQEVQERPNNGTQGIGLTEARNIPLARVSATGQQNRGTEIEPTGQGRPNDGTQGIGLTEAGNTPLARVSAAGQQNRGTDQGIGLTEAGNTPLVRVSATGQQDQGTENNNENTFQVPEPPIELIKDYGDSQNKYTAQWVFTNENKIKLTPERLETLYKKWTEMLTFRHHKLTNKLTLAYNELKEKFNWNPGGKDVSLQDLWKNSPKRNQQNVRPVGSKPMNFKELKCRRVCRSFLPAAQAVSKLQRCSTFENAKDALINPKCQHFMLTYDELDINKTSRRKDPIAVILMPKHVRRIKFGNELVRIGTKVLLNRSDRVITTSDPERYYQHIFGSKQKEARENNNCQ